VVVNAKSSRAGLLERLAVPYLIVRCAGVKKGKERGHVAKVYDMSRSRAAFIENATKSRIIKFETNGLSITYSKNDFLCADCRKNSGLN
jgi:hypothetical protein